MFFLPLVFVLYWMIPGRLKNSRKVLLVLASYGFYAFADWRFCGLLFATTCLAYWAGRAMHRIEEGRYARSIMVVSLAICLAVLVVFKYLHFFAQQFVSLLGNGGILGRFDSFTSHILLPLGVSFYVFMAMSYIIDRYRKVDMDEPSFLDFTAYICFFPHLLAGPIDRAREFLPQLKEGKRFDEGLATDGMRQLLCGLFKKVVVADNVAVMVNNVWNSYDSQNSLVLLMAAVLYSIQIYMDFSGYSDMAIGTGKLFGLRMRQNFSYPYFARNISEFWRGWHMSLTSWFTEYLYIPLGGNRRGNARTILNTLIVFTLCGLWHGANWTYVIWGGYSGLMFIPLILHKESKAKWKEVPLRFDVRNLIAISLTFACITSSWIFFRAPSLTDAFAYIGSIFGNFSAPLSLAAFDGVFMKPLFAVLLLLMIVMEWMGRKEQYPYAVLAGKNVLVRWTMYLLTTLAIFAYNTDSGAFIYQNF